MTAELLLQYHTVHAYGACPSQLFHTHCSRLTSVDVAAISLNIALLLTCYKQKPQLMPKASLSSPSHPPGPVPRPVLPIIRKAAGPKIIFLHNPSPTVRPSARLSPVMKCCSTSWRYLSCLSSACNSPFITLLSGPSHFKAPRRTHVAQGMPRYRSLSQAMVAAAGEQAPIWAGEGYILVRASRVVGEGGLSGAAWDFRLSASTLAPCRLSKSMRQHQNF